MSGEHATTRPDALGVMPAHSRPKDGVLSHTYVAGIHVFSLIRQKQVVDGRDKPGHDGCF